MKIGRFSVITMFVLLLIAVGVGAFAVLQRRTPPPSRIALPQILPPELLPPELLPPQLLPPQPVRMERPHGMAPIAFEAYIRACVRTGIHPVRLGQTIGDHPRSVGYHKRDGVLQWKEQKYEYTTAVDIGVFDLSPAQIDTFLRELSRQGFAAWYRHGPKWVGGEHIHAVYAFLPMKPQLKGQVWEFVREQNPPWEKKWRRSRFARTSPRS